MPHPQEQRNQRIKLLKQAILDAKKTDSIISYKKLVSVFCLEGGVSEARLKENLKIFVNSGLVRIESDDIIPL